MSTLPVPPPGTDPQSEEYRRFLLSLSADVNSGLAPIDAQYWLSTANGVLTADRNLGALASGYVKITTVAGVATPSSSPTIPLSDFSGTVPIAKGGTNSATPLSGASIVVSNGTEIVQGEKGTANEVLHGNPAGEPTYGPVDLSADVTGDLPFANLAQGAATSVLGVSGGSAADVASIAASADGQVLRRAGASVGFGAVDLASSEAISGNLPVAHLNSGTDADATAFWRGDGIWSPPPVVQIVRTFTDAEMKAWGGVAQLIIPAVAGYWICVESVMAHYRYASGSITACNASFRYVGTTQAAANGGTLISAGALRFLKQDGSTMSIESAVDLRGVGVEMVPTASQPATFASASGMHICMTYALVPTP